MEQRINQRLGSLRAVSEEGKPQRITGVAAVFYRADDPGTEYQLWGNVYERIAPEAFERAVSEDDVRALFNHRMDWLLGRRRAGDERNSLRIWVEDDGLHYDIEPSESQQYQDVVRMINRGDLSGSSFQFMVRSEDITRDTERDVIVRTLNDVSLIDVSPVTFPAYESTSAGVRCCRGVAMPEIERIIRAAHPTDDGQEVMEHYRRKLAVAELGILKKRG
jgi:hypothetical protein